MRVVEESVQNCTPVEAGNPDLCGVGVRTGVYCQWLATVAANAMDLKEEISAVQTSNLCFQIALITALLFTISGRSAVPLSAPEVPIVLSLCFGGFAAANAARLSSASSQEGGSSFVRSFRTAQLFGLVSAVNSWFWWRGLRVLDPDHACNMFFFARVGMHRLRVFCCVLSVIACLLFVLLETVYILIILHACRRSGLSTTIKAIVRAQQQALTPMVRSVWLYYTANGACIILLVFMALTTELTLSWNKFGRANDFDTVGQLIPLVVAIGNLLRVIYCGYRTRWNAGELDPLGFYRP